MVSVELHKPSWELLSHRVDGVVGTMTGSSRSERRLGDLAGCFADPVAYRAAMECGNPLVYSVESWDGDDSSGALSFGLGRIEPGRVGDEFYLTKGHFHARREAAEVYIALRGSGGLVLEDQSGDAGFVAMAAGDIVYVPGHTAHRSVNCGDEPFTYLGVYAADAGHDYGSIAEMNFALVVLAGADGPIAVPRAELLAGSKFDGRRQV